MWCDTVFSLVHPTCMFSQVLRVKGTGFQACDGKISPDAQICYMLLFQKGEGKADSRNLALNGFIESVNNICHYVSLSLESSCKMKSTNQVVDINQMCMSRQH